FRPRRDCRLTAASTHSGGITSDSASTDLENWYSRPGVPLSMDIKEPPLSASWPHTNFIGRDEGVLYCPATVKLVALPLRSFVSLLDRTPVPNARSLRSRSRKHETRKPRASALGE